MLWIREKEYERDQANDPGHGGHEQTDDWNRGQNRRYVNQAPLRPIWDAKWLGAISLDDSQAEQEFADRCRQVRVHERVVRRPNDGTEQGQADVDLEIGTVGAVSERVHDGHCTERQGDERRHDRIDHLGRDT